MISPDDDDVKDDGDTCSLLLNPKAPSPTGERGISRCSSSQSLSLHVVNGDERGWRGVLVVFLFSGKSILA